MGRINLNNLNKPYLTKEKLLEYISDENIFRYYIKNFRVGKAILSPLRKEKIPSFGVFLAKPQNELFYKDFKLGSGDCIKFVSELLNLSRKEALIQIAVDFGISDKFNIEETPKKSTLKGTLNKSTEITYTNNPKVINVTHRNWEKHDIDFWNSFGISVKVLKAYNVYPVRWIFINDLVIAADKFAYAYTEFKDGILSYKIYQPYSKYKWLSNHNSSVHQGYSQLPSSGKLLIITKSLKDVMSLCNVMKIPSIAIQNESIMAKQIVLDEYLDRFDTVVTLFDNDEAGITLAFRYKNKFNIPMVLLPYKYGCKDFSDLVEEYGVEKSYKIFKKIINEEYCNKL